LEPSSTRAITSFATRHGASLSADGRYVTFTSIASNLVAGDSNGEYDVFVRDRQTGSTNRLSVDAAGNQVQASSFDSSISADGLTVAFASDAATLVSADTNGLNDVFVVPVP
jgi:Tol biopolymer transport system component